MRSISGVIASSWIDGAPVTTSGSPYSVTDPANGNVVAEMALAQAGDVDIAVAAARAALPGWSGATPARDIRERAVRRKSCQVHRRSGLACGSVF
jgi:acyl-CoA reductase-like NAD-dependent aldehyde dehydrogenase